MKSLILSVVFAIACVFERLEALDYSHLQLNGLSCRSRDSCLHIGNAAFANRNCECGRICSVFRDCCIDAQYRSAMQRSNVETRWTCMPFGESPNTGAYVVNRCPLGFDGPESVRRKCEGPIDYSDPLMTAVPVTDTTMSVNYRNRPCAECNDVSPSRQTPWRTLLDCSSLKSQWNLNNTYILRNLRYRRQNWGVDFGGRFHKCTLVFDVPTNNTILQLCRTNVISSCPSSWGRYEVKANCESYMALTYAINGTEVFRNPDCAICNGFSVNSLTCDPGIMSRKRPMSFALLLDVNQSDGDEVGVTSDSTPSCSRNQKYDPFFKRCRNLVCADPSYVVRNGKCVSA